MMTAESSAKKRILIVSSDILPFPGMPTVGSGLRAWGLGHGLMSRGHEVLFSIPRAALNNRKEIAPPDVVDIAWEHRTLTSIVKRVAPDIVVVCNWPVMRSLQRDRIDVPVVLDQHGPHNLEREYQNFGNAKQNAKYKIEALKKADFFTCAGRFQREYFKDWLARAGWSDDEQESLTGVIPISLSPQLPERKPADDLSFVYGGVFLPWQDPTAGLFALIEAMERYERGKLYFYGGKHPVYPVESGIFEQLLEQLKQSPHVIAPGMVPHADLIEQYTQAHVAIDVMKRNPERELAFTTRTVEYLWCGLPVIYHDYAEISQYIADYEAGWLVNPENPDQLKSTMDEIFNNPELVAERSANAQRLIREQLTWDRTITPIDTFAQAPQVREHSYSIEPLWSRDLRYIASESWFHFQRRGISGLWREGWSFIKRQVTY